MTRDLELIQKQIAKSIDLNATSFAKLIASEYKKALDATMIELSNLYDQYSVDGVLTYAEMSKFNRLKNLEKALLEIHGASAKTIKKMMNKYVEIIPNDAYYRYIYSVDQASGVELNWGNPGQIKQIAQIKNIGDKLYLQAIKTLSAEQIKKVNNAIISGLIRGESYYNMVKQLRRAIIVKTSNALRIIRTETNRLSELGHYEEYLNSKKNGVYLKRQLIATLDNRTRPQSAQMDGQYSNEDGLFLYPNGSYYIPGSTGVAEWDIHDRERVIEIIDGYAPRIRRTRTEGLIPFQTFRKWAEKKNITKNVYGQLLFKEL